MHTNLKGNKRAFRGQEGQALAEFFICLIVIAVLFLGILLFGELCRARLSTLVESRTEAGGDTLLGMMRGSANYYGGMGAAEGLKTEVLSPTETPIAYAQMVAPNYAYMEQNLVAPLYDAANPLISSMYFSKADKTRFVTNAEGLYNLKVGPKVITVTQSATMPIMQDFD